jgi:hypothetical protein
MGASVEHGLNNSAPIPPLESGDRLTRHELNSIEHAKFVQYLA